MGIQIEFNPDLALRDYAEFEAGRRKEAECLPKKIEAGQIYSFLKKDQRNYWFHGEIPLIETKGNQILSRPIAGIRIIEVTHFLEDSEVFTKGKYKVIEVFNGKDIYFEGFCRVDPQSS